MTDHEQLAYFRIYVDGRPVLQAYEVETEHGLDLTTSRATWPMPVEASDWIGPGMTCEVVMGEHVATARTHFLGYVREFDEDIFPGDVVITAKGLLSACETRGKGPNGVNLAGLTDQAGVRKIIVESGVPAGYIGDIGGTGKTLGTTQTKSTDMRFRWGPDQTGTSKIQDYDQISIDSNGGWVTHDQAGGTICRRKYKTVPSSVYVKWYQEGVNLLVPSRSRITEKPPTTYVKATGWKKKTFEASIAYSGGAESIQSDMIESALESDGVGISAQEVANGRLNDRKYTFQECQIETWEDDLRSPGDVVKVTSRHLKVDQTFYVKNVVDRIDRKRVYTKRQTIVSELGLGANNRPLPPGSPPPPATQPATVVTTADFAVLGILRERVIVAGVVQDEYSVSCVDTSTSTGSTIASRAWTASGTGAHPTSGTDRFFTATFDTLVGAAIELVVTDALSNVSDPKTLALDSPTVTPKVRDMEAAASDVAEDFSGADLTWRKDPPSGGDVTVCANGPAWGGTTGVSQRSADHLATSAPETTPFGAVAIEAAWIEPDVNINLVAATAADGRVAFSVDAGATWDVLPGPDGSTPVRKLIISRHTAGQAHAITQNGYWVTDNYGSGWRLIHADDYVDLDLSDSRNYAVFGDGSAGIAESGDRFTGHGGDTLIAITSDARTDRAYAIASNGHTYYLATDGATAWTAGADVPAGWGGTTQARGMYRDGLLPSVVYFAAGAGGIGKTVDGFASVDGYRQLRARSIDGAGAGSVWTQIGVGLLATVTAPASARRIYLSGAVLSRSDDNGASFATILTGTAASGLYLCGFLEGSGGNDIIYAIENETGIPAGDDVLHVSTDGGVSFSIVTPPRTGDHSIPNQIAVLSATTALIVYDDHVVMKTTNGGSTWSDVSVAYGHDSNPGFPSGDALWLPIAVSAGKLWSSDLNNNQAQINRMNHDGSSLEPFTVNSTAVAPWSDADAVLYGGSVWGDDAIRLLQTTTITDISPPGAAYGATWQSAATPDGQLILASVNHFVFPTTTGEIWRTDDGGATWAMVAADANLVAVGSQEPQSDVDLAAPTFWAVLGADLHLWTSDDGGLTFTDQSVPSFGSYGTHTVRVFSA